ncbi:MAG: hypothetical protein EXR07_17265, partial [Acetobacteraceae bacterium]|nr:hypothetical protein [Acetobacteraceae bacterium]
MGSATVIKDAIRSILRIRGSPPFAAPIPGLFETLDAAEQAGRLLLKERGAANGKRNVPATNQDGFDDVEQDVLQTINVIQTRQRTDVVGTLKALRDMVAELGVASQLGRLQLKAREASAQFAHARADIGGSLARRRADLLERQSELSAFRAAHGLNRLPTTPWPGILTYGLLFFLIAAETAFNSTFFAKGSELGLAGGIAIAFVISAHYCPEFSERTVPKCLTYNGFSTILGGVGLKLVAVCPTLVRGGLTHERR